MLQQSRTNRQMSATERTEVAERVVAYLRRQHPTNTAKHVAQRTGHNVETVQKLLERCSMPSGVFLLDLMVAYEADFLVEIMRDAAPAWVAEANRLSRQAALEAQLSAVQSELAALRGQ